MASTESSRLLGKKPSFVPPSNSSRYASSSTSRHGEQDLEEETQSIFSHVSLDVTPTYGRLIASHILSLLPGIALLLATVMLAFHAPCHIQYEPHDRKSDRKLCRQLLSDWMSLTAFTLGVLCWIAAYTFRPAISKVIEWGTWILQFCFYTSPELEQQGSSHPRNSASDIFSTLLFVFLRTIILESIRMFNIIIINAVLFAGLAHLQRKEITEQPHQHWLLHWFDPRFTVGLWTAIGWCTTEFLVSTFQMFDRLSLYKSVFEQVTPGENINTPLAAANNAYTPPASSFIDSNSAGDYTSDSAATVRAAHSRQDIHTSKPGLAQNGHSKDKFVDISSTFLQARNNHNNSAANQGSGFSLADEAEEEEIKRLREKLEEEIVQARMRDEVRQTLGQDLPEVPILLCALWRIDSLIWNIGTTLLMAASVSLAQGCLSDEQIPRSFPPFQNIQTTLYILIALHSIVTSAWTLLAVPFGFAFVTYTSLLAGLGLCISGLFRWRIIL